MENQKTSLEYKIRTIMESSAQPSAILDRQYPTHEVVRWLYYASSDETKRTLDIVFEAITGETLEKLIDKPWGQSENSEKKESAPSA